MAIGRIVIDFGILPDDRFTELLEKVAEAVSPVLDPHEDGEPCVRWTLVSGTQFPDEDYDIDFFSDDDTIELLDVLPTGFGEEFNPN